MSKCPGEAVKHSCVPQELCAEIEHLKLALLQAQRQVAEPQQKEPRK